MTAIRVAVVDDHPIVCRGLVDLIGEQPGMTVVGQAGSIAAAMALLAGTRVDVAIIDLWLGQESGLDLVVAIARTWPTVRMLVLSGHDERLFAERALAAGALGFIMKERAASELLSAVSQVAGARSYISPAIADQLLASTRTTATPLPAAGPLARLSNRERHVLVLLGQGASRSEIAQTLGVSVKTVESHCANIKGKLGARNARDLARMAVSLTSGGSI